MANPKNESIIVGGVAPVPKKILQIAPATATEQSQGKWLAAKEAAYYLRTTVKGLYGLRNRGLLKGFRRGGEGTLLFDRQDLDEFVTRGN